MAQPTTTFLDELMAAARGCAALLIGNRQAPSYFDFSQRGLVGSFIALVIGLSAQAFGPQPVSPPDTGSVAGVLILTAMVVAIQIGVAYVVLRLLGRGDGFTPFVVVLNWASMFQGLIAVMLIVAFGPILVVDPASKMMQFTSGSVPYMALSIAALVVWVNIARLVLTLRPKHVALFVIAQLGAAFIIQLFVSVA